MSYIIGFEYVSIQIKREGLKCQANDYCIRRRGESGKNTQCLHNHIRCIRLY